MTNRKLLFVSTSLAMFGWGALMYFTYVVRPNPFAIGIALILLFLACLGTVMPILYYLNLRFGGEDRYLEHPTRPMRQSLLVTGYVTICVLLRILSLLNWIFALFILGVMIMAEVTVITWFD